MSDLFRKYYLSEVLSNQRKNLLQRIDKLEVTDNTDIIELVGKITSEFTIYPIIIGQPEPSQPRRTTRQIRNDWGEMYNQNVVEITVTIPFEGD